MTIEQIDQQLKTARAELSEAQDKLDAAIEHEKDLAEKRSPLLRDARVRGNTKAQQKLDKLTRERFEAAQEIEDLRASIKVIQTEIADLEREQEQAERDCKIEALRALMSERNRLGELIQGKVDDLTTGLAEYINVADKVAALVRELELPNGTTRALIGTPLLKDFILHRLKFIFSELGWTDQSQRLPLTEMEKNARETLDISIASARKVA